MNILKHILRPRNINSYGIVFLFFMREFFKKIKKNNSILNILIYFGGVFILNYIIFIYNYWIPLNTTKVPPKTGTHAGGEEDACACVGAEAEADADDSHYSISQISILWYNTYSLPILTTRYHIQAIVDYIGACMTKHKVNVIGLCEVWLSRDAEFMSKYILEMLGPDWTVYISSKNKLVGDGIILFWNKSEVHIGTLFSTKYGLSCGLDSLVSKGFISTLITPYKVIDNKRVLAQSKSQKIIFTHMQDFADSNSRIKASTHSHQLKQLHSSLIYNYPTFIVGDLNFNFYEGDSEFCSHYKLVPTTQECVVGNLSFKNRITCYTRRNLQSFDYVLKEKHNAETTSRFQIIRDVGLENPSDHEAILFTLF